MLQLTVGEKKYESRSCNVQCYVVDPATGQECNIFAYVSKRGQAPSKTIPGFLVQNTNFIPAREGIKREAGGYWSTLQTSGDAEILLKLFVKYHNMAYNKSASRYFVVRNGCAVGSMDFVKVPEQDDPRKAFSEETIQVLSGSFEPVSVEDAEEKYRTSINPIFRNLASPANYNTLLKHSIIREATIAPPVVEKQEVVLGTGETVIATRRRTSRRRTRIFTDF